VNIRANNSTETEQISFQDIKTDEENLLEIDVTERFGSDVAIFPLKFVSIKMIPTKDTPKGECYVTLPGIIEVFSEQTTDVEDVTSNQSSTNVKYIQNGNLYIQTEDKIYNILGAEVSK
jgi:hypothetical protein